jgi:DNA-directed RNA polymerase specialized sigma24 family protein
MERILSRYFARLVEWSQILTRGDQTAADEIVQDLCLHLTVAQPDLSGVNDLDAYLYMCLRNMYISRLARVSREQLRVIQVEDYDDARMVVAGNVADSVDVQNELFRICDYTVSRKYSSKSASHFILHFFHGYRRSDVALLARLPIAAIYNKLKDMRSEVRDHLSARESIRVVARGAAPEREPHWSALASDVFLKELRSTIFDADSTECVAEVDLIDAYKQERAAPVGCRELAHLAGCERCLNILERALRLDDRDSPLDGMDGDRTTKREGRRDFKATMRVVRRRREQLLERRPALLAIAVDGRVVAFHAVESSHNSLSSRVEASATVRFIEVFDEFGDRLAHIPLDAESSAPLRRPLSQQILLSDNRKLRLDIRFDGLGIHAEADYTDPSLAASGRLEDGSHSSRAKASWWTRLHWPGQLHLAPWMGVAFASVLLVLALAAGAYRYMHPSWRDVLASAQAVGEVPSQGEALRQTLRIEEPEHGAVLGSVEVWRLGDRKVIRQLYNAQQELLATSIVSGEGGAADQLKMNEMTTGKDRRLIESGVWRSDVSSAAFDTREGAEAEAQRESNGFEVTRREDGRSGIFSRTLVLDRDYRVQAEKVRYRTSDGVSEVRLVQTLLRRVPNTDVPALIFPQSRGMEAPGANGESTLPLEPAAKSAGDAKSADLEVAVLFELFQQRADTGQPIEVIPIAGGRIRMTGTLTDGQLLAAIRERVSALPNAGRVDFQMRTVKEAASAVHPGKASSEVLVGTSSDAPAAGLVREALIARGLKGDALKNGEQQFAASALSRAQAALQHASALNRLGLILRRAGQSPLDHDARVKWARMVDQHSTAAMAELRALRLQLDSVSAGVAEIPPADSLAIADAAAFVRATSDLRMRTQSVNREVVELFAGSAAIRSSEEARESIVRLRGALPVAEASRMSAFASRLASQDAAARNNLGEMRTR